jgi:predicted acylesterase/phospholipase RssA
VAAAVRLSSLTRNQSGILQSEPVYAWIERNVDPGALLAMPLVWAVTNLTKQRPEYFFVNPNPRNTEVTLRVTQSLQISLGPQTVVREATPDLLHRALFASCAIPIAFDPVEMPGPDGTIAAYCDGGIASNSPVGVAHAIARAADVILLDPPLEGEQDYDDAVSVTVAAFGTVQRKLLEVDIRNAYFQSVAKRALARLSPSELTRVTHDSELLARYVESVPATDLRYIRPAKPLPVGVIAFGDAVGISKTYRSGWQDAARGFTPYDWETFVL